LNDDDCNTDQPMPSNDPTRTITLFGWILDASNQSFSVSIEDSRTVDDLKDAILKKNPATFANVDPFELTLWKVCRFDQVDDYILTPSRNLSRLTRTSRIK
jgi:hypothetical protein